MTPKGPTYMVQRAGKRPDERPLRLLLGLGSAALAIATANLAHAQSAAALRASANAARGGVTAGVPSVVAQGLQGARATTAGMTAAALRSAQIRAHATDAVALAASANAAARSAARSAVDTSGVPNGLGQNGLQPAVMAVTRVVDDRSAAGVLTWEGADLPTQTAVNGQTTVTVRQYDQRAVLSWTTFNVGRETTLVFDQKQDGAAQTDWVVVNRVVGQLDPTTGRRDPSRGASPSQILGAVKADGTVVVINQNGIVFTPTAQINAHSLIATSLELTGGTVGERLRDRSQNFLTQGFTFGSAPALTSRTVRQATAGGGTIPVPESLIEGGVEVQRGAQLSAGTGGFMILSAPTVINGGQLSAANGQVSLAAGRQLFITQSSGAADSANPNVRGLLVSSGVPVGDFRPFVRNTASGQIDSARGYLSLVAPTNGAVIQEGVLTATTSVSRNGFVDISAGDVRLAPNALIFIDADASAETIPIAADSVAAFKPSRVSLGSNGRIEIGANATILAPGADVIVGGSDPESTNPSVSTERVFIDTGAVIDVSGFKDVLVPASRNQIRIQPVTRNELRDTPQYRGGFLQGATVFVDPRISGVRADGVAYIGSPLIEAGSFAAQVGVGARELLARGGSISLGARDTAAGATAGSNVIVKRGALLDVSGGWVRYEAGVVQTSRLVTTDGLIVDIGVADPNVAYTGLVQPRTESQTRFGVSESFYNPLSSGARFQPEVTEGRDAGAILIQAASLVLDGQISGRAYAGGNQIAGAARGTRVSTIRGDRRSLQQANSQLPAGGYLRVGGAVAGDIRITDAGAFSLLPDSFSYGQSVSVDSGNMLASGGTATPLPAQRRDTIFLRGDALSDGLAQISLATTGALTLDDNVSVTLQPGGAFTAVTSRAIRIGQGSSIVAQSGAIDLTTSDDVDPVAGGSIFSSADDFAGYSSRYLSAGVTPGEALPFDIRIEGSLLVNGQFVNDFGVEALDERGGGAYVDGGAIRLQAAPNISVFTFGNILDPTDDRLVDISGSIIADSGARLDLSGGAYVAPSGALDLSSRGGDLTLIDETAYFQNRRVSEQGGVFDFGSQFPSVPRGVSGIRTTIGGAVARPLNPERINARVLLGDGVVRANGFTGGGTFALTTPSLTLVGATDSLTPAGDGTVLRRDFISQAGFGAYDFTVLRTDFSPNRFVNAQGLSAGGTNALLATTTIRIGMGESVNLTQSVFSPLLTGAQAASLRELASGASLYSDAAGLTLGAPAAAFDQQGVRLGLGGLTELVVENGGRVVGAPGAAIIASKLIVNDGGVVRLPGGAVTQRYTAPDLYAAANIGVGTTALTTGIRQLSDIFTVGTDGAILESAPARNLPATARFANLSNAEIAAGFRNILVQTGVTTTLGEALPAAIYLLGEGDAADGVVVRSGGVLDLSGVSLRNPRSTLRNDGSGLRRAEGRLLDGGAITISGLQRFTADAGARVDLSGVSDVFDVRDANGGTQPQAQWSNGGSLFVTVGSRFESADLRALGGSQQARGGTLTLQTNSLQRTVTLTQFGADIGDSQAFAADTIVSDGFDSLIVNGGLQTAGPVSLTLRRSFFVNQVLADSTDTAPAIATTTDLAVAAPFIRLQSPQQIIVDTSAVPAGVSSAARFAADAIDLVGGIAFSNSITSLSFASTGDIRLIGVVDPRLATSGGSATTLFGSLVTTGDLEFSAAQIYPTTGTTFTIASSAATGRVSFNRPTANPADDVDPLTPYSAGSTLTVLGDTIVQNGVLRAPLGTLNLGSTTQSALSSITAAGTSIDRPLPVTRSLTFTGRSLTSVSANGLSIPYGTTTDQQEYFFTPTQSEALTAPPAGRLNVSGQSIAINSGADVDLRGGGDVYGYEFISGVGGSRDVLSRFNNDDFSGNSGFQYPDARQVYAIVPSLRSADVALIDPLLSSDYGALYANQAGRQVFLEAAPGIAAGWYTLLPAQYALLPGGLRVVEQTGQAGVIGASSSLLDGSTLVSGYYGTANTGQRDSRLRTFSVQDQATFRRFSNIALTSGSSLLEAQATRAGRAIPQLPRDAAQLSINAVTNLAIDSALLTSPAAGGRGTRANISGADIIIAGANAPQAAPGQIVLSATGLTNLNAGSLLIGGARTDNSDGSTTIATAATRITLANDAASPLQAPEILLTVGGANAALTVNDGAVVRASGAATDAANGEFRVSGAGALLRVSTGGERALARTGATAGASVLDIGAATISGASSILESSGRTAIDPTAGLTASNLIIGARDIQFSQLNAASGQDPNILLITPALQAQLGRASKLTFISASVIRFAAANYSFGAVAFDTPGLALATNEAGQAVTINAASLTLGNSTDSIGSDSDSPVACGNGAAPACGVGSLAINTGALVFGDGALATYGFGGGVSVTATGGVFVEGESGLAVGPAGLAIVTPYLGDRARNRDLIDPTVLPQLLVTSSGAITVSSASAPLATLPTAAAGARIVLRGETINLTDTTLRASAGQLTLAASGAVEVGGAATLATPAYASRFGDAADAVRVSAPGGAVTIISDGSDVTLGANSRIVLGGNGREAGSLRLFADSGEVVLGSTIDATLVADASDIATDSARGASLDLASGGAFDLARFVLTNGVGFTGDISVRTGSGDLSLDAGQTIRARNLRLTADGGNVSIRGAIDVSGVNGGEVGLYGAQGLTLASTARINASATGYGHNDTRSAKGGSVSLGVAGGALTLVEGAAIDLGVHRTDGLSGDRFVPEARGDGFTYFTRVAADQGGTLLLRAPIVEQAGPDSVNISSGGSVAGARSLTVEAYKRFDLAAVAADSRYAGVTVANGVATLDTRADQDGIDLDGQRVATGRVNFLSDNRVSATDPRTVISFIQDFDISGATGLGGLSSLSGYQARPGIELGFDGDIVLASNWNLGAGAIDVTRARAETGDRLLDVSQLGGGRFTVQTGAEATLLQEYGTLFYRVGGAVDGAASNLALRATGNLILNGSLSDGFFTFRDQSSPDFLRVALGGVSSANNQRQVDAAFTATNGSSGVVTVNFDASPAPVTPLAPYSALGNSAAALGTGTNGAGDPLGSAQLFPLLANGDAIDSTSYALTAGAASSGSANPVATRAQGDATVRISGESTYAVVRTGAAATGSQLRYSDNVLFTISDTAAPGLTSLAVRTDQFLAGLRQSNAAARADTPTVINFNLTTQPELQGLLQAQAVTWFDAVARPELAGRFTLVRDGANQVVSVQTDAGAAADFFNFLAPQLGAALAAPGTGFAPAGFIGASAIGATGVARTQVRTGTGDIQIAAAGDIDLRGTGSRRNTTTGGLDPNGQQTGGSPVYTAGRLVSDRNFNGTDTGSAASVSATQRTRQPLGDLALSLGLRNYTYGAAGSTLPGLGSLVTTETIAVTTPVQATDGGAVTLAAGGNVRSQRDLWNQSRLSGRGDTATQQVLVASFAGDSLQLWRPGAINDTGSSARSTGDPRTALTVIRVNPNLFTEGVGTLGGGDVRVQSGGLVADLTAVATDTVQSYDVTGAGFAGAQVGTGYFGGGNLSIVAVDDVRGGRFDVSGGAGEIRSGGAIGVGNPDATNVAQVNGVRLRIGNARLDLVARDTIDIAGAAALGVRPRSGNGRDTNVDGLTVNVPLDVNNSLSLYTQISALGLRANNDITLGYSRVASEPDSDLGTLLDAEVGIGRRARAVLPGTLEAASLAGAFDGGPLALLLQASPVGQLRLFAQTNFSPAAIAMLDQYQLRNAQGNYDFLFPSVLPDTGDTARRAQHNPTPVHLNDPEPVRIAAGGDLNDLTLSLPKQARVNAGRDIVDILFIGQNVGASDATRLVAGRDITATTQVEGVQAIGSLGIVLGSERAATQGNNFILGGPGAFFIEAGRDAGPFLTSATVAQRQSNQATNATAYGRLSYAGGIQSVGNDYNPWLAPVGADVYLSFGVGNGANYDALRDFYVDPANVPNLDDAFFAQNTDAFGNQSADRSRPIYAPILIDWVRGNAATQLVARFGTTDVTAAQAYQVFRDLPPLVQRQFLIPNVYFNELVQAGTVGSPSFGRFSRGYAAPDILFSSGAGYSQYRLAFVAERQTPDGYVLPGNLPAGAQVTLDGRTLRVVVPTTLSVQSAVTVSGQTEIDAARTNAQPIIDALLGAGVLTANDSVSLGTTQVAARDTGSLDLRLATVQTTRGGDINILGPGGRVLGGSTVRTSEQADRRNYAGGARFQANGASGVDPFVTSDITEIPTGFEGILSLRGGVIRSFTDGSLVLNQSRLFSEAGGDIILWSSGGDLNAGQGPRTSANFPPIVVRTSPNASSEVDATGAVTGAGIAAFQPSPDIQAPNVFLLAPLGTVDAGDAGVRSAGTIVVVAQTVANAAGFSAAGGTVGVPGGVAVDAGANAAASAAAASASAAAEQAAGGAGRGTAQSRITVEVLGFGGQDPCDRVGPDRPKNCPPG